MQIERYEDALCSRFRPLCRGVEQLFAIGEIRELKKGDILYRTGDRVMEWPILLSGCAKQLGRTENGDEIVVGLYVSPGDNLLPYDPMLGRPISAYNEMQMTRAGVVLFASIEKVLSLMREEPELMRIALTAQADYLNWYMRFHFAQSRYRNNLKGLFRHIMQMDPELVARSSIADLASFLSVSYYHLSRVRQELKREEPELFEALKEHR